MTSNRYPGRRLKPIRFDISDPEVGCTTAGQARWDCPNDCLVLVYAVADIRQAPIPSYITDCQSHHNATRSASLLHASRQVTTGHGVPWPRCCSHHRVRETLTDLAVGPSASLRHHNGAGSDVTTTTARWICHEENQQDQRTFQTLHRKRGLVLGHEPAPALLRLLPVSAPMLLRSTRGGPGASEPSVQRQVGRA